MYAVRVLRYMQRICSNVLRTEKFRRVNPHTVYILETKNPVFTVLKRQRCRNAQEVNDISTPFYTPFHPVVHYSNYQGSFLHLNPEEGQETNIAPDNRQMLFPQSASRPLYEPYNLLAKLPLL